MSIPTQYDTIIIGSGQGGTPLARALALANHKTALIEREHIGGCCVNDGCTPTKTMIASGRVAYLAKRGGKYGVQMANTSGSIEGDKGNEVVIDIKTIRQRKRDIVDSGRVPNTERLNAAAAGVKMDKRGYVVTNEFLETSSPSIYAMGDVKGPPSFTHISYDDFRVLRPTLLGSTSADERLSIRDRIVPYVAYTDPQFGHVGLHEHEARERFPGRKILTAQMPMSYVARALETDETRGAMKAVVDGETGQILGFTCLGVEGGEIMSIVQTAMMGNLPYQKLQDAVFAHPTFAESLNNLWGFLK
ncbi:dihydrolipoamide dehydrogenase [Aspergillus niger ATCC 1015]|uniref:Dihydrolipoamide dehydrogenase n=1 Tax=Aspergillus niger (strain ATCC 1015 / CBS 113.46 / FGSC A1144 / LSHB Ac4 / NCTC 3858a / NRRL 328 / USDA 3528.7) TaxID=380704 RepID=G3XWI7_ASPNA|nr:dihydrolipoamide dehydrogenase [Aspergillus niger ATCC 1015]